MNKLHRWMGKQGMDGQRGKVNQDVDLTAAEHTRLCTRADLIIALTLQCRHQCEVRSHHFVHVCCAKHEGHVVRMRRTTGQGGLHQPQAAPACLCLLLRSMLQLLTQRMRLIVFSVVHCSWQAEEGRVGVIAGGLQQSVPPPPVQNMADSSEVVNKANATAFCLCHPLYARTYCSCDSAQCATAHVPYQLLCACA